MNVNNVTAKCMRSHRKWTNGRPPRTKKSKACAMKRMGSGERDKHRTRGFGRWRKRSEGYGNFSIVDSTSIEEVHSLSWFYFRLYLTLFHHEITSVLTVFLYVLGAVLVMPVRAISPSVSIVLS